jgi:hypothetical protein
MPRRENAHRKLTVAAVDRDGNACFFCQLEFLSEALAIRSHL